MSSAASRSHLLPFPRWRQRDHPLPQGETAGSAAPPCVPRSLIAPPHACSLAPSPIAQAHTNDPLPELPASRRVARRRADGRRDRRAVTASAVRRRRRGGGAGARAARRRRCACGGLGIGGAAHCRVAAPAMLVVGGVRWRRASVAHRSGVSRHRRSAFGSATIRRSAAPVCGAWGRRWRVNDEGRGSEARLRSLTPRPAASQPRERRPPWHAPRASD